ncbi:hypothetical protein ACIBO9_13600 [Streptomyces prunicolor]
MPSSTVTVDLKASPLRTRPPATHRCVPRRCVGPLGALIGPATRAVP